MMFSLFRRNARQDTISALYGTIVAQARLPCFYREFGVPDTLNGRFDLLVLHLATVLARFAKEPLLRELGQGLFDRFCQDMDDNLREMGVGDLAVPNQMKRMGEAFYGRAEAYRAALTAANKAALEESIIRNIYDGTAPASGAACRLAGYIQGAVVDLARQEPSAFLAGRISIPDPIPAVFVEDKSNSRKD